MRRLDHTFDQSMVALRHTDEQKDYTFTRPPRVSREAACRRGPFRPRRPCRYTTTANARLTWRNGGGDWESSLEVTNLTDQYYFLTRFDQFSLTGITDGQPGRPREWAITVKRKF